MNIVRSRLDPASMYCHSFTSMMRYLSAFAALLLAATVAGAKEKLHTFEKIQVTDKFWGEGANFGDFNHDGHMDIVSGPYWYEGPDFKVRHQYCPATQTFKKKNADANEKQ